MIEFKYLIFNYMLKTLIKEYVTLLIEARTANPFADLFDDDPRRKKIGHVDPILLPTEQNPVQDNPELESIEAFATYLMDDDREEFTHDELVALKNNIHVSIAEIKAKLESLGFRLAPRIYSYKGEKSKLKNR